MSPCMATTCCHLFFLRSDQWITVLPSKSYKSNWVTYDLNEEFRFGWVQLLTIVEWRWCSFNLETENDEDDKTFLNNNNKKQKVMIQATCNLIQGYKQHVRRVVEVLDDETHYNDNRDDVDSTNCDEDGLTHMLWALPTMPICNSGKAWKENRIFKNYPP